MRAARGPARTEKVRSLPPAGAGTSAEAGSNTRKTCELCGESARVDILEGYVGDVSVRRHLCLRCARTQLGPAFVAPPAKQHLGWPFFFALVGASLAVLGVCGDLLARGSHPGFGWYQGGGVAAGVLLMLAGSFFRAEILALAGAGALMGALLADVHGGPQAAGIGWKQQALIGVGAACVMCAVLGRLVSALRAARAARSHANPPGIIARCRQRIAAVLEQECGCSILPGGPECGAVIRVPEDGPPTSCTETTGQNCG